MLDSGASDCVDSFSSAGDTCFVALLSASSRNSLDRSGTVAVL